MLKYLHSLVIFIAPCSIKRGHTVLFHAACSDHITRLSPRLSQISMNIRWVSLTFKYREKERKTDNPTITNAAPKFESNHSQAWRNGDRFTPTTGAKTAVYSILICSSERGQVSEKRASEREPSKNPAYMLSLLGSLFDPLERGDMVLRNVGISPVYTAIQLR